MHNPKLLKIARRLLPRWLRARLDPFHIRIEDALRQFAASLPQGARVLDAGAGECGFRRLFAQSRYVGVDSAVGDAAWDYTGIAAVADVTALPFRDASFDAAISIVTFEHIADPAAAVREIRRALRDGGQFFLAVPQFWELHQAPHDYFRYTRFGTERLLRDAGFDVERLEPTGGYFQLVGKLSIDFLHFFEGGLLRIFWVLLAPVFGLAIPLVCYYLDKLDRRKDFAIGYIAVARAVATQRVESGERAAAAAGARPR